MMRRTGSCFRGYVSINPDTSPMLMYSNYHWHYNFRQGMHMPHRVNRRLPAPYVNENASVNRYRGLWVDTQMHPAFRAALEPQLMKLPHGRVVPPTPVSEVVEEYEKLAPLIDNVETRDGWLAKILQHCAFHRDGDAGLQLWQRHAHSRYITGKDVPPLPLIQGMLFCASTCDLPIWRDIFNKCLKEEWNYTPAFTIEQWNLLLQSVGRQGDEHGVELLFREAVDVQVDLDRLNTWATVIALNSVRDPRIYNYIKQFLFHFGEKKVEILSKVYGHLRGHGAKEISPPLPENDNMYYHVCWHANVRQPRQFVPRQLYFDYKPSSVTSGAQSANTKIEEIVKDKIAKWKEEGVLPEDYEFDANVIDKSASFKNIVRQEKWKKVANILKKKELGYTGEV